jgi:hypothetical protein
MANPKKVLVLSLNDIRCTNVVLHLTDACMKRNGLEALNFQHKINYNRSTNIEYTTETIMFYTRCYNQYGKIKIHFD